MSAPFQAVTFHDLSDSSELPAELFKRTEADLSFFTERVAPIIEAVRTEGDAALRRFARDFDGVTAPHMSILAEDTEFETAFERLDRRWWNRSVSPSKTSAPSMKHKNRKTCG